jgi:hypothetical protein
MPADVLHRDPRATPTAKASVQSTQSEGQMTDGSVPGDTIPLCMRRGGPARSESVELRILLSDWLPDRGEADAGQSPDHQN